MHFTGSSFEVYMFYILSMSSYINILMIEVSGMSKYGQTDSVNPKIMTFAILHFFFHVSYKA